MRRVICVPRQGKIRRQAQGLIPVILFFSPHSKQFMTWILSSTVARDSLGVREPREGLQDLAPLQAVARHNCGSGFT